MTTSFKCNKCKDTGWIETENGYKRCECYYMEQSKRRWEAAGINPEQATMTFSNYKTSNEITKIAKNTAIKYFKNFKNINNERYNSIAFLGQVGSGKTHLTIALGVNLISKNIPVMYMPYRDVITNIKQNMLDEVAYNNMILKYKSASVLLIDDLFKGKLTKSDVNIMFEIINYRYLNNLPIIVSSEMTAEQLLDIDEAVGSRIIQMCKDYTVEIRGKENNYRLKGTA